MVKIATTGKSRCNKAARKKSDKKEIKKAMVVLKWPLTVPLKNKTMGSKTRRTEPTKGTKAVAKTNAATTNKSFKKEISRKVIRDFSKDDNLLTANFL